MRLQQQRARARARETLNEIGRALRRIKALNGKTESLFLLQNTGQLIAVNEKLESPECVFRQPTVSRRERQKRIP